MKVELFKALWGMTGSLESQVERIAAAGYHGVECPIVADSGKTLVPLLAKHKLKWIGMIFTGGATVDEHIASFRELALSAADLGPLKITSHSSRDKFSTEDQYRFFGAAAELESKLLVQVNHETHRGRATYAPWSTVAILDKFPSLRIVADFSHWVCVCENLMADQDATLEVAMTRARHIHARVGYEQGPQVTDPAAPEYKTHLERHLGWWDRMVELQSKTGASAVTITPEFGPPGYQHTVPYTNVPLTDLWTICLWTADLLRKRYA